tara:strand:- start:710 stop:871 length:162 start_codon:yes stop_codon:yes gene_type:complete
MLLIDQQASLQMPTISKLNQKGDEREKRRAVSTQTTVTQRRELENKEKSKDRR